MKAKGPRPVIIKKYENRRLYNTLTSQYINQEQVAQLVRDGQEVRVIDVATGEDITRLILAQIILEDAKTPDSVFPLDVLRQMVLASGKATQENALRYLKAAMEMYQNAYRALPSPLNPFEFMPPVWAPRETKVEPPPPFGKPPAEPAAHPDSQTPGQVSGDGELRRRIEELEAALSRRNPKTKARRPELRPKLRRKS